MRFLFWNTNKNKSLNTVICDIAREYGINFIILAEYEGNIKDLLDLLESNNVYMGKYITTGCNKLVMLGDVADVEPSIQAERYSIQIIRNKYILCSIHLTSQIYSESADIRKIEINSIKNDIENVEKELKTDLTILTGDFNEDPYDDGCLTASSFHGLPCKNDTKRRTRVIAGNSFSMFYNPMWNFFGDRNWPPGTYYFGGSKPKNSFWHIYDQVLIRPSLIQQFSEETLEIITSACSQSLLDAAGKPNFEFSDHLPITFEIREERI